MNRRHQDDLAVFQKTVLSTLINQQKDIAVQLQSTGAITLSSGRSYAFTLESFCIDAGETTPLNGDSHAVSKMDKNSQKWLSEILAKYNSQNISQKQAQLLIWSLKAGLRYDQLSENNRKNLLKIFPDAAVRFGNYEVESSFKEQLFEKLPEDAQRTFHRINEIKNTLQNVDNNYEEVEALLAPSSGREISFNSGWTRMPEGYFLIAEPIGYQKVNIKIFVPQDLQSNISFDPTLYITSGKVGQRLGLSRQIIEEKYKQYYTRNIDYDEAKLILQHPIDAVKVAWAAQKAIEAGQVYFPSENPHNTKADAFRHFMWAGLAAHGVGSRRAKEFLDAHENKSDNPEAEKTMDLNNNQKGFNFHEQYKGQNFESDLIDEGRRLIKEKNLKWLQ